MDETFRPEEDSIRLLQEFKSAAGNKLETASIIRREMKKAGLEVFEQEFTFNHKLLADIGVQ